MRFASADKTSFQIFAVSGTNTISFGIKPAKASRGPLLGFAVERLDAHENERYFMPGFKVFPSVIPHPDENTRVSTLEHPIQSLVWDDFTAKPDRVYEYIFHPIRGTPKNLDRSEAPISIKVKTEKLYGDEHDIFFNRGVASSQAYRSKFNNKRPDELGPRERELALQWLTRELDDAALKFINDAEPNEQILGCFYEFRYEPVAQALRAAAKRGVDVRLVIDAKKNEYTDSKGVFHASFPREDNLEMLNAVGFNMKNVVLRDANKNHIQHNKFMVLLDATKAPKEVWTGSTNISQSGFAGQTNVGHWVRNAKVAAHFKGYWDLLAGNPGVKGDETRSDALDTMRKFRAQVEALTTAPGSIDEIPAGVTSIFSPRLDLKVLDLYYKQVDTASDLSCITLAFGINARLKEMLSDNTPTGPLIFMLLEKEDEPNPRSTQPFVEIDSDQNVYKAWGAFIEDPLYQWARETNTRKLALSHHVSYIHSKFLLRDPLGKDPIVVTGSANFSDASTRENDENMMIVRGNTRVADIYFTEFNRLFNHYYFRAVVENTRGANAGRNLFLDETGTKWLERYLPGKLRAKRLESYVAMESITNV